MSVNKLLLCWSVSAVLRGPEDTNGMAVEANAEVVRISPELGATGPDTAPYKALLQTETEAERKKEAVGLPDEEHAAYASSKTKEEFLEKVGEKTPDDFLEMVKGDPWNKAWGDENTDELRVMTLNMEFYAKLSDAKLASQVGHLRSIFENRKPHFVMVQEGMAQNAMVNQAIKNFGEYACTLPAGSEWLQSVAPRFECPFAGSAHAFDALEAAGLTKVASSGPDMHADGSEKSMKVSDMLYGHWSIEELYQRTARGTPLDGGKVWKAGDASARLNGMPKADTFFSHHLVNQIYVYAPAWESRDETGFKSGPWKMVDPEDPKELAFQTSSELMLEEYTESGSKTDGFYGLRDQTSLWWKDHAASINAQSADPTTKFPLAKRSAVWVKVQHEDGRTVHLYNTHFSGGRFEDIHYPIMVQERKDQMTKILTHFKEATAEDERADGKATMVLVGDFNADASFDLLKVAGGGLVEPTLSFVTHSPAAQQETDKTFEELRVAYGDFVKVRNGLKAELDAYKASDEYKASEAPEADLKAYTASNKAALKPSLDKLINEGAGAAAIKVYNEYMKAPFIAAEDELEPLYDDADVRTKTGGVTSKFGTNVDWMMASPNGLNNFGMARDLTAYQDSRIPKTGEQEGGWKAASVDVTDHNTITLRLRFGLPASKL